MKQIRVKMTEDHTVDLNPNETKTYPAGIVFPLPEGTAHEFVKAGVAGYVNPDDAKAAPQEKPDDGLDKMKKDDLEALAKDRGVDLGEAKTRAEIIDKLRAAPVT